VEELKCEQVMSSIVRTTADLDYLVDDVRRQADFDESEVAALDPDALELPIVLREGVEVIDGFHRVLGMSRWAKERGIDVDDVLIEVDVLEVPDEVYWREHPGGCSTPEEIVLDWLSRAEDRRTRGNPSKREFRPSQAQLEEVLRDYEAYGGAKIAEIVHSIDPDIDIGGGGAYPMRLRFAELYDLPDLERRLRKIAVEDPDGLWRLKGTPINPTKGIRTHVMHIDSFGRPPQHVFRITATSPDGQTDYGWLRFDELEGEDIARVNSMEVREAYRRRGVAMALYDVLYDWAAENGLRVQHGMLTPEGAKALDAWRERRGR